ncbi:hypothetical protein MUP32_05325, partial [Candidatus Microgenomates bacterium]|nr:hypothetical protein [Candidatus Microgenomates bacterium]
DYLFTGGFPNVINEYFSRGFISSETYETYITWIEGDIEKEGRSPDNAYRLLAQIHANLGSRVSYTELARNAVLSSQKTVQEYLEILRMMFVVFETEFYSLDQKRADPKKNKKIYFTDPFIHNCLMAKEKGFLDDAFSYTGKVLLSREHQESRFEETAGDNLYPAYAKFYYGNYGTRGNEIDFVGLRRGKYDLLEVKRGQNIELKKYEGVRNVTVITYDFEKKHSSIKILPFYKYFLSDASPTAG